MQRTLRLQQWRKQDLSSNYKMDRQVGMKFEFLLFSICVESIFQSCYLRYYPGKKDFTLELKGVSG